MSVFLSSQVARSTPFDNTSNSFVAAEVQSAIEEAKNSLTYTEVTADSSTTTTSGTDSLMNSMTITPTVAGSYLVMFSTDINSNAAGAAISTSFYLAGSQIANSLRKIIPHDGGALSAGAARGIMYIQKIVSFSGANTLEVRWSTSSGTATAAARNLVVIRVGA